MLIRTPDYYDKFKCIAGECKDTCCAGWQVDVDDASYEYYKTITGDFGDRLHSVMVDGVKGAEGQFCIREDGRCPFLNDNNLCDLYTALGEDALCVTCDQYPRYTTEYGNLRETGIALSCQTAAELILTEDRTPGFTEHNDEDAFPALNDIDGLLFLNLRDARKRAFDMVWNRETDIYGRMRILLDYAINLQRNIKNPDRLRNIITDYNPPASWRPRKVDKASAYRTFWKYYLRQVIIKREWVELAGLCESILYGSGYDNIESEYRSYCRTYAYEYENILSYFVFRYFLKGVFDSDVLTKVKMAIVSTLMIMQCDMAVWKRNGGSLSFTERVDIAHLYSREVEHSEENFAALCKLFAHKKVFDEAGLDALL